MYELIMLFFKILIVLLVGEGVVFGFILIIMLKGNSIAHREDEERMRNESDRLSEED